MSDQIDAVSPSTTTAIAELYERPDYRDAFLVASPGHATIEDFASAYFLQQPQWLSMVSMNLTSRARLIDALGDRSFPAGSAVGSWKIHRRRENEIVFGDDMGFMEYRFSLCLHASGDVEASTAVKYRWPRASRFYFGLVKPMHRRFVPISLRAALKDQQENALV